MSYEVKCQLSGIEYSLLLDKAPQPGQTVEIDGRKRTIVRVAKTQFGAQYPNAMSQPTFQPQFSIEVE
jgi:hypothetical protein